MDMNQYPNIPIDQSVQSPVGYPVDAGYSPRMLESSDIAESGSFMKWQISPSDILIEILWHLRGHIYDDAKEKWIKVFPAQMSEKGISETISRLRWHINKNTVLSNLDEDDVRNITIAFGNSLINLYKNNWEQYGIERTKLTSITFDITNMVFYTLKRAKDMAFLKHLETVERVNTVMREGFRDPSQGTSDGTKGFSLRRLFSLNK